ncbi:MAG: winged helix-turn-helix transcriptional regulator, partial [Clostridiales bacterium]|nr:winged helix-turn-helix transcriptional regulator [Clostridiales bacterium]
KNPRHIVSTEQFMERVWGWESDVGVSIVWVYISNLRKKLLELGARVEIRATRGVGYSVEAAR